MNASGLIDPKQKATINRRGFGFWSMNSTGKLSETRAAKGSTKLCMRCYTSAVKRCSLRTETCSDMENKWWAASHGKGEQKSSQISTVLSNHCIRFQGKKSNANYSLWICICVCSIYPYSNNTRVLSWRPGFIWLLTLALNHLYMSFWNIFLFRFLWELSYM